MAQSIPESAVRVNGYYQSKSSTELFREPCSTKVLALPSRSKEAQSIKVALIDINDSSTLVQYIHDSESILLTQKFALVAVHKQAWIPYPAIAYLWNPPKYMLRS